MTQLHIEHVAIDKAVSGDWLTTQLGIACHDNLFAGADIDILNRWPAKATPAERALLEARLGGWVAHFGYDPDHIGRRPGPATSKTP